MLDQRDQTMTAAERHVWDHYFQARYRLAAPLQVAMSWADESLGLFRGLTASRQGEVLAQLGYVAESHAHTDQQTHPHTYIQGVATYAHRHTEGGV